MDRKADAQTASTKRKPAFYVIIGQNSVAEEGDVFCPEIYRDGRSATAFNRSR